MALILLLVGFTAVVSQVILLRELMVVFGGNEISIGIALAAWMLWTAAGSALAGRLAAGTRDARRLVAALEVLIAAALPLSIAAVRNIRALLGSIPGEILGPAPMLGASVATLSLLCLSSGGLFAACARSYAQIKNIPAGHASATVYLYEAAGSGLGGLAAALALVPHFDSTAIAFFLVALNLAAAAVLWRPAAILLLSLAAFPTLSARLEQATLARLWKGFRLVESRNSPYGNLAVIETGDARSVYESGLVAFTVPDPAAAEEAVHYALLEHPHPGRLLLIGGGSNGSLLEALKHPTLRQVDYVELDPALLDVTARHFPAPWNAARSDSRVRIHNTDGRLFVRRARSAYDVLIVNLPDPLTVQLNRFYTVEFFTEAARALAPGGILALRLPGSENYISEDQAAFLRSIKQTLRQVFPEVLAFPGATVQFFATTTRGLLTADPNTLLARLAERRLNTEYVREYYLPFRLAPDRMTDLEAQLRARPATPINRDFAPVACYLDMALWSAHFRRQHGLSIGAAAALALLTLVFAVRRGAPAAGLSVAAMGFTMIGLEIMLLAGFQAAHGSVYQQLAMVIAAFLAGMALGSWCALRFALRAAPRRLLYAQAAAAVSGLLLYGLLNAVSAWFGALALLCGLLGGFQFATACRRWPSSNTGALYAFDLAGAALGALLFSAWLLPVLGFLKSAWVLAALNLAALALLWRDRRTPAP